MSNIIKNDIKNHPSMNYTLNRHKDILLEYSIEFKKTKVNE
jgi:hypothetical protein